MEDREVIAERHIVKVEPGGPEDRLDLDVRKSRFLVTLRLLA
jgi:hypothetical protein